MKRARAAGVVLVLAVATAWPAAGRRARDRGHRGGVPDASPAEAVDDPSALAELRRVDSSTGQPVDVRGALRGARGDDLEARLRHARGLDSRARPSRSRATRRPRPARCSPRTASRPNSPRPFRGFFEWLGDLLPDLDWLDDLIPGPPGVVWLVLAALVGGIAWVARPARADAPDRTSRRPQQADAVGGRDDPRSLERLAAEAEAAGDLRAALRLRFRAGLLRLDAARRDRLPPVDLHPRGAAGSCARRTSTRSRSTFDDVVYGGRAAEDADVERRARALARRRDQGGPMSSARARRR